MIGLENCECDGLQSRNTQIGADLHPARPVGEVAEREAVEWAWPSAVTPLSFCHAPYWFVWGITSETHMGGKKMTPPSMAKRAGVRRVDVRRAAEPLRHGEPGKRRGELRVHRRHRGRREPPQLGVLLVLPLCPERAPVATCVVTLVS